MIARLSQQTENAESSSKKDLLLPKSSFKAWQEKEKAQLLPRTANQAIGPEPIRIGKMSVQASRIGKVLITDQNVAFDKCSLEGSSIPSLNKRKWKELQRISRLTSISLSRSMNLENKSISEILRILNVRIMFQQNSNVRMEARIHKCVFLKVCPGPIICLSLSNDCGRKEVSSLETMMFQWPLRSNWTCWTCIRQSPKSHFYWTSFWFALM